VEFSKAVEQAGPSPTCALAPSNCPHYQQCGDQRGVNPG